MNLDLNSTSSGLVRKNLLSGFTVQDATFRPHLVSVSLALSDYQMNQETEMIQVMEEELAYEKQFEPTKEDWDNLNKESL